MKYTPTEIETNKARFATSCMFFVCGLAYSSWAPMIPFAKANLELSEASLGMLLLLFGIGALISMPITGWAVHRFGSNRIASIATPCMIFLLPLLATAPSSLILGILLFAFGSLGGALNVSMNSHSVAVEVYTGRPIISRFHCLFSLGGLFGAGTMSLLLERGMSLFASTLCIITFMTCLAFWQFRHLLPPQADIKSENSDQFSFPQGRVLFYGALCFILFLAEGSMLDWGAVFLCSSHGYDHSLAGIGYAIFSVAMSIGRFTGDRMIMRFGKVFMVQAGGMLAAAGMLLAINCSWGNLELLGFFLIGLGAANIVPIMFGAAGRLPETSASVALTIVITMGYSGMLLGPAFIGWIAEVTSISIALGFVAFLLVGVGFSARYLKEV